MSNTIIELKHSQVSGNVPSSLANGEISINTYDGKLFYKSPSGTIQTFNKYPGPSGLDGEIQFNDSGDLGASANLSFNKTTGTVTTKNLVVDKANIVSGNAYFESVKSNSFVQFGDGSRQYTANAASLTSIAAFNTANAAYNQANVATSEANSAYEHANSAYDKANSINAFAVISVSGQSNIVASSATTLNIEGSGGITVTTNASSKTITITGAASATSLFVDGGDFGLVTSAVVDTADLGTITSPVTLQVNLGGLAISGLISPSTFILPSYTVSTLPNVVPAAQMIFVSDESGGAVIAFSDGTNWRRVTDRAIVT